METDQGSFPALSAGKKMLVDNVDGCAFVQRNFGRIRHELKEKEMRERREADGGKWGQRWELV